MDLNTVIGIGKASLDELDIASAARDIVVIPIRVDDGQRPRFLRVIPELPLQMLLGY